MLVLIRGKELYFDVVGSDVGQVEGSGILKNVTIPCLGRDLYYGKELIFYKPLCS